jgi:hypothetical protein
LIDEKVDITTNTNGIQRIIREYFENLYSNKLKICNEFLAVFDLTKIELKVYMPSKQIYNKMRLK